MKNPKAFLQDKVFAPMFQFQRKYLSRYSLKGGCKNVANFIFNRSKETALIMLVFNAISILSSHISQIGGLKRSKRENKDYLINQEWKELGLDLLLTIVPPFVLNNYLMKKFDSGEWTTRSARKYLIDTIAPTVGASRKELYNTDHIKPFKETVVDSFQELIRSVKKSGKLPKGLNSKIPMPPTKVINKIPMVSMEDITTDFDLVRKGQFKAFRNGKAYDEINGQRNGLIILATIAYTVLASNVIMPILKNKLANHSYKKKLEKMGETPESMKRKKRFSFNETPVTEENNIFNQFTTINKNQPVQNKSPFDNFNNYYSKHTGLRI